MKVQICLIENGILRHFYYSHTKKLYYFSRTKATNFSPSHAREIINYYRKNFPEKNLFIQIPGDVHYRATDENNRIIIA